MNDKGIIIAGLAVFIVLATFPIWYTLAAGGNASPPVLKLPADQTECVKDAAYMRDHHMDLLDQWRDEVVRQGDDSQIEIDGTLYDKSLTKTCMACHTNRQEFCAACHEYANVQSFQLLRLSATSAQSTGRIRCWDCHLEQNESKGN